MRHFGRCLDIWLNRPWCRFLSCDNWRRLCEKPVREVSEAGHVVAHVGLLPQPPQLSENLEFLESQLRFDFLFALVLSEHAFYSELARF